MECKTCKYWHEKKYYPPGPKPKWGMCSHLTSGAADKIEVWTNDRDGKWYETTVETLPDFFCAEYDKRIE